MKMSNSRNDYGFGETPRKRGHFKQYTAVFFCVVFFSFYFVLQKTKYGLNQSALDDDVSIQQYHYLLCLLMSCCAAIMGKVVLYLCAFVEELRHIRSRYDNSKIQALKNCFQVFLTKSTAGPVVIIICITVALMIIDKHDHTQYWLMFITSVGVAMITNYLFNFQTLSVVELSEINESSETNVAQGLAWSYFTGYLEIVLPELLATISKDTKWNAEYEKKTLPCKLFAIVPLNCEIPDEIGDLPEKHTGITFEECLPPLTVNRAGVRNRKYINSVYKIVDDNGKLERYAICEYVTIINTLHRMPLNVKMVERTRKEQCRLLVRILNELIENNPKCRDRCKIVTYSGEDGPYLRNALLEKKETTV